MLRSEARDLSFLERFFKFKQHLSYQPAPLQLGDIDTPGSRSGESVSGASPCCTWGKGVLGSLASLFPFPEGWRKRQASIFLPSFPPRFSSSHLFRSAFVCVCAYAHHGRHVEVRGQLMGVSFLPLPCGSQGSNLGCQAW